MIKLNLDIAANMIGVIALILTLLSYQNNNKSKFLLWQILANLTLAIQYLLLNATSAVVAILIALTRNIVFFKFENKNKEIPLYILILFEIAVLIFGVFTFDGIISLFPVIITMLFSYAAWQKKITDTYLICVLVMILYIIYNFYVGAYVSIISNILELSSAVIGKVRLNKIKTDSY